MKDLKKIKIAVLSGGLSSEREVSLVTGRAMYEELKKNGHNAVLVDVNSRSLSKIEKLRPDVVLNGLHGTYGEDGVMQGILDFLGVPYAGSGVLGCSVSMDKILSKEIMSANGVLTPRWQVLTKAGDYKLKYPAVLKPAAEGSAVGVFIVKNKKEAAKAFPKVKKYGEVLAEEYIKGTEISVPVLGSRALPAIEIVPSNEFYDYDAKYTPGRSNHIIPARIGAKLLKKAGETALKVHRILRCKDFSRTDMIVAGGKLYVLETNALPGMTGVSLFPESARAAGIDFYSLICEMIRSALRRAK